MPWIGICLWSCVSRSDEAYVDVETALQMAGWAGGQALDPIELLEQVHMALCKSSTSMGEYAANLGTDEDGEPLVVYGGGGNRPAQLLRIAGDGVNTTAVWIRDENRIQIALNCPLSNYVELDAIYTWNYLKDVDINSPGISLVQSEGTGSIPARVPKLKGAGGLQLQLSEGGSVLTLTAPEPVAPLPPPIVSNVGSNSLIALTSSANNVQLRGLIGAGGVTVQALSDANVAVGLASEITGVARVAPTNKLLTVVGDLRVESGSSLPGTTLMTWTETRQASHWCSLRALPTHPPAYPS